MIPVDRNISPPPFYARQEFPFREMEAGDSFFVPGATRSVAQSIRNSGQGFVKRQRPDLQCIVRREADGFRCWLIVRKAKP